MKNRILLFIGATLILAIASCKKDKFKPTSYWQFDDSDSVSVAYKQPHERLTPVPINTDGNSYGYYEYLPQAYFSHPKAGFALVLFLHGNGQAGDGSLDSLKLVLKDGPLQNVVEDKKDFKFICIAPQASVAANDGLETWHPDKLNNFLEYLLKKYRIRPERVYVTGLSAGGSGSILFAQYYPGRIAAIAPISAEYSKYLSLKPLKNMPMWCFVNSGDVYAKDMEDFVAAIRNEGGNPHFTEYNASGHNAWDEAYSDDSFWNWLLSQSK